VVYTSQYPIFFVTADIAVFSIIEDEFRVLLVRRSAEPESNKWALPGGFVDPDEDLVNAAKRELEEEAGAKFGGVLLEQLRSYGAPNRDPRGRVISVAYVGVLPTPSDPTAGSDAAEARWQPVDRLLADSSGLAFDHDLIVRDAVERVRSKLEYTTLATAFVGSEFTLSQLRRVYEAVWGAQFDAGNFQRKMKRTEDFIEPTGNAQPAPGGRGRPAATFRARQHGVMPLLNPITR
jgi:8-oxo-dGTP diphosphatase